MLAVAGTGGNSLSPKPKSGLRQAWVMGWGGTRSRNRGCWSIHHGEVVPKSAPKPNTPVPAKQTSSCCCQGTLNLLKGGANSHLRWLVSCSCGCSDPCVTDLNESKDKHTSSCPGPAYWCLRLRVCWGVQRDLEKSFTGMLEVLMWLLRIQKQTYKALQRAAPKPKP